MFAYPPACLPACLPAFTHTDGAKSPSASTHRHRHTHAHTCTLMDMDIHTSLHTHIDAGACARTCKLTAHTDEEFLYGVSACGGASRSEATRLPDDDADRWDSAPWLQHSCNTVAANHCAGAKALGKTYEFTQQRPSLTKIHIPTHVCTDTQTHGHTNTHAHTHSIRQGTG